MIEKRYELGEGDKGTLIYDNTGPDDYYFINDPEELEDFIKLINESEDEWQEKYNHLHGEYVKTLQKHSENLIKITEYEKKISDQEQIINKLFIKNKKLEKRLNKREKGEYDPIIYKGVSREDFDKLSDIEKEFYESEWEKFVNNGW